MSDINITNEEAIKILKEELQDIKSRIYPSDMGTTLMLYRKEQAFELAFKALSVITNK